MKITALNGKEYETVGMTKEYGELLRNGSRYYFFSRRAGRMMPVAKMKAETATFIEA